MTRNEGTIDRVLRVVLGLILLALVFVGPQTPWGWIGIVPLVTGLVGDMLVRIRMNQEEMLYWLKRSRLERGETPDLTGGQLN